MPRATGNQRRREVCGSTMPTGEEKHLFPWQLPHLTTVQSALFGASENQPSSRFPAIYLPHDYQPTVKTPQMLKTLNAPKGCLLGAMWKSMERKIFILPPASISKFSWISRREHSANIISWFFTSPWCCFSTHSQQPWKLKEWQMAVRKLESPENQQRCYSTDKGEKGKENKNKINSSLGPRAPPISANLLTLKSKDSRWKHFYFFKLHL